MQRLSWICRLVRDIFLCPIIILMPRSKRKIIFGAWMGKQYGCNPKYLFEYFLKRGGFDCYWIGNKELAPIVSEVPGAKFIAKGSVRAFWHCLTAKFYVYNIDWKQDIISLPNCSRVKMFYTTHGYPDKLVIGQCCGNGPIIITEQSRSFLRKFVHNLLVAFSRFLYSETSWFSASSPQGDRLRVIGEPVRLSYERALKAGLPRADFEIKNANNLELCTKLREKYAKILGIDSSQKWYLFVPTWRNNPKNLFSFSTSSKLADYEKILSVQNAVIIEKQHPHTFDVMSFPSNASPCIRVVSKEVSRKIDTQELQLVSDRLITDYSSVYYDSVLMNRPVIHFTYDFDNFMNVDMGFAFDIRDYGGGPFAYSEKELMSCLEKSDEALLALRSPRTISEQLTYEQGHSCEKYYEVISSMAN